MSMSTPSTHSQPGHENEHAAVTVHVRAYMLVFGALLVLTGVTVALSYFDFGSMQANIVIAMIVATVKAGLVALIFMHLNHERRQIYVLLAFTVFFACGLFFLTWLHYWDPIRLPH